MARSATEPCTALGWGVQVVPEEWGTRAEKSARLSSRVYVSPLAFHACRPPTMDGVGAQDARDGARAEDQRTVRARADPLVDGQMAGGGR